MVPLPISTRHSSRLLYLLLSVATQHVPRFLHGPAASQPDLDVVSLVGREEKFNKHDTKSIVFAVLIPVLVLSSGLFAGLTLGYMSLDETQLNVLSISGTPEQKKYANKIKPIRQNGHLLLVTLLLANMIVNETLPVIADGVLGGGVQAVIISTVLIVIFAEIIPQSLFTRHGLYLGAKLAGLTKVLIYALAFIAWPVAKLLEFVLGPHHGIIYRRGELKELIAMHSTQATHGGDLKLDTVTIIGATLDLQEKVVRQAMTPISDVFMLSIDSKLDYALLKKICETGHSRVPVYEEIDVPYSVVADPNDTISSTDKSILQKTVRVKKIIGILLVKQCVLLDPKDATPLRQIPLNKVPFVPNNEPLLGILDKFQEGRSHMAIVSRFSVEKAASVKREVKRGLTQRLRERVGMGDTDSDTDSDSDTSEEKKAENGTAARKKWGRRRPLIGVGSSKDSPRDIEEGNEDSDTAKESRSSGYDVEQGGEKETHRKDSNTKNDAAAPKGGKATERKKSTMVGLSVLEQSMPADAVLAKEGAAEFLQGFDPAVMPLGIITLEDVLEELIGEEIYDEFDDQGAHGDPYQVPPAAPPVQEAKTSTAATPAASRPTSVHHGHTHGPGKLVQVPAALKGIFRTRSAPPVPRDGGVNATEGEAPAGPEKSVRIEGPSSATQATTADTPIQMPRPVKGTGRHPPSVILEQHSSVSSTESDGPNPLLLSTQRGRTVETSKDSPPVHSKDMAASTVASGLGVPQASATSTGSNGPPSYPGSVQPYPTASPPMAVPASVSNSRAPSRDASPAPPLEAILLERKRRLATALGYGFSPTGTSAMATALAMGVPPSPAATTAPGTPVAGTPATPGFPIITTPGVSSSVVTSPSPMSAGGAGTGAGASLGGAGGQSQGPATPGAAASPVPVRVAHSVSSKGTRFKSSPLGGVERAGLVVAEHIKAKEGAQGQGQSQSQSQSEEKRSEGGG